jgi:hypothetical protein
MRIQIYLSLIVFAIFTPLSAHSEPALLRVSCQGDDVGAKVTINGKFKGECPIDLLVTPGKLKLRVLKSLDESSELFFEQEIRIGDGALKKIQVVMSTRLSAAGNAEAGAKRQLQKLQKSNELYNKELAQYNYDVEHYDENASKMYQKKLNEINRHTDLCKEIYGGWGGDGAKKDKCLMEGLVMIDPLLNSYQNGTLIPKPQPPAKAR